MNAPRSPLAPARRHRGYGLSTRMQAGARTGALAALLLLPLLGACSSSDDDEAKALALIDSGIAGDAAVFMVTKIGDEPANTEAMKQVPDAVFTTLGLTRDLDAFLKSGTFQKPLPNKDKIVAAWTEIKSGVQ